MLVPISRGVRFASSIITPSLYRFVVSGHPPWCVVKCYGHIEADPQRLPAHRDRRRMGRRRCMICLPGDLKVPSLVASRSSKLASGLYFALRWLAVDGVVLRKRAFLVELTLLSLVSPPA